jgi:hypothetical protein
MRVRLRLDQFGPYAEDPGPASTCAGRLVPRRPEVAVTTPASLRPVHTPLRPTWLCRGCADPWPCPTARRDLLTNHADDLVFLAVFMATTMTEAIYDLVELNSDAVPTPAELWDRFMAWLDRARRRTL